MTMNTVKELQSAMVRDRYTDTDGKMMGLTTSRLSVYTKRSERILIMPQFVLQGMPPKSDHDIFRRDNKSQSGYCVALGRMTPSRRISAAVSRAQL